jgi:hypothetical protein
LSAVAVVVGACQASSGSTAPTYKPAPCPNPIVAGAPQFDLGAGFVGREAHVEPVAGTRFENWDTDEPSERGIDGFERMRLVRDDITDRVADLLDRIKTPSS